MKKHSHAVLIVLLALLCSLHAFAPVSSNTLRRSNNLHSSPAFIGATVVQKRDESDQQQESSEQFNWFKAWYPLVPVEILDREKPHQFELLGQSIVVWNDGVVEGGLFGPKKGRAKGAKRFVGTWRAFVDECPHRKVPLSEGRVEDDGTLLCSYHAWRFDGQGSCVAVPQVESEDEFARLKANPKTSCNAFPTRVINGVLFVWPSSDENAVLESELTPVAHRPANEKTKSLWEGPWTFRELPYGADYFIENVVDPAHVTVSHHNVAGSRYGNQAMHVYTSKALTKDGFSIKHNSTADPKGAQVNFYAPSLVAIDTSVGEDGAKLTVELYVSPSRPGFCNHIGRIVIVKGKSGTMPKTLRQFQLPVPIWLNHVLASAFLNQDALFLHGQERTMAMTGQYASLLNEGEEPYQYSKAVYPTRVDKGVLHFRNWISQFAGGRIPYRYTNKHVMPPISKEVVFDVWNGHTKYCKYCQDALGRLRKVRFASFFAAACLAVIRPLGVVGNLLSTLGLLGCALLINKLIGMFYRYEFSHAHND